ncbi:conserved hypothetical protein [Neospora caninum Liverpool]|uniref:Uncharacterized protein n=1 Tax=Neospora caninum (strain Liverpool) TaxID=572307 RepID=F0V841_NEOCL|nr:conserved hypothetical protein [Neospora caninum Liverpool]CBZ49882.1 conserved hypothetical protein [Neospora caninum Liverpool]|eukprot:XP_003879917.1 conserved hypothetical protein [Neospora caninum Liverpool]
MTEDPGDQLYSPSRLDDSPEAPALSSGHARHGESRKDDGDPAEDNSKADARARGDSGGRRDGRRSQSPAHREGSKKTGHASDRCGREEERERERMSSRRDGEEKSREREKAKQREHEEDPRSDRSSRKDHGEDRDRKKDKRSNSDRESDSGKRKSSSSSSSSSSTSRRKNRFDVGPEEHKRMQRMEQWRLLVEQKKAEGEKASPDEKTLSAPQTRHAGDSDSDDDMQIDDPTENAVQQLAPVPAAGLASARVAAHTAPEGPKEKRTADDSPARRRREERRRGRDERDGGRREERRREDRREHDGKREERHDGRREERRRGHGDRREDREEGRREDRRRGHERERREHYGERRTEDGKTDFGGSHKRHDTRGHSGSPHASKSAELPASGPQDGSSTWGALEEREEKREDTKEGKDSQERPGDRQDSRKEDQSEEGGISSRLRRRHTLRCGGAGHRRGSDSEGSASERSSPSPAFERAKKSLHKGRRGDGRASAVALALDDEEEDRCHGHLPGYSNLPSPSLSPASSRSRRSRSPQAFKKKASPVDLTSLDPWTHASQRHTQFENGTYRGEASEKNGLASGHSHARTPFSSFTGRGGPRMQSPLAQIPTSHFSGVHTPHPGAVAAAQGGQGSVPPSQKEVLGAYGAAWGSPFAPPAFPLPGAAPPYPGYFPPFASVPCAAPLPPWAGGPHGDVSIAPAREGETLGGGQKLGRSSASSLGNGGASALPGGSPAFGAPGDHLDAHGPGPASSFLSSPPPDTHPVLQQQAREQEQQKMRAQNVAVISPNVWKKIDKLRRAKICLNCRQQPQRISNASGAPSGVCSGCTRHVGRQHCKHCGIEFLQHHYCAQAEKLLGRPICLGCARQMSKYQRDPSICRYCKCWSAWNEAQECERCRSRIQRHGMPRRCERCGVDAAFPRSSTQAGETGETLEFLCFLCSFAVKKALLLQQRSRSRAQQTLQLLQPGRVNAAALEPDKVPKGLLSGRREAIGATEEKEAEDEESEGKPASYWKNHAQTLQQQNEEFLQQLQHMQEQLLHKDLTMQEQQQEKKEQQQALQHDLLQEKRRNQQLLLDLKRASVEQEAQASKAAADQRRAEEVHLGLSNALHECIDQLKHRNEELELANKRCTSESQQYKKQNQALIREMESVKKELSSAISSRDSALSSRDAAASKAADLEASLAAAQRELAETKKKLADLEEEFGSAQAKAETATREAEVYRQRVQTAEGEARPVREEKREQAEAFLEESGEKEREECGEGRDETGRDNEGQKGEEDEKERNGEEDEKERNGEEDEKERNGEEDEKETNGEEDETVEGELRPEDEGRRKGVSERRAKRGRVARHREEKEGNGVEETVEQENKEATLEEMTRDQEEAEGGGEGTGEPATEYTHCPSAEQGEDAHAVSVDKGAAASEDSSSSAQTPAEEETGKRRKRKRTDGGHEDAEEGNERNAGANRANGEAEMENDCANLPARAEIQDTEQETEAKRRRSAGEAAATAPQESKEASGGEGEDTKESAEADDEDAPLTRAASAKINKRGGRKGAATQRKKPKAKVRGD